MSNEALEPPWIGLWRTTQAELLRTAAGGGAPETMPSILAARRMLDMGGDYAALAADYWRRAGTVGEPAALDAAGAALAGRYLQLFMAGITSSLGRHASQGAVSGRWERATARLMRHAEAIAIDAGRRLSDALAENGPEATPVTTLRGLFELWVACGEAAWAAAVHHDDFAEALAECLEALVELRRNPSPR